MKASEVKSILAKFIDPSGIYLRSNRYTTVSREWLQETMVPAFQEFLRSSGYHRDLEEHADLYALQYASHCFSTSVRPAFGCCWQNKPSNLFLTHQLQVFLFNPSSCKISGLNPDKTGQVKFILL